MLWNKNVVRCPPADAGRGRAHAAALPGGKMGAFRCRQIVRCKREHIVMAAYSLILVDVLSARAWYDLDIQIDAGPLSPPSSTLVVIASNDGTETRIIGTGFTFGSDAFRPAARSERLTAPMPAAGRSTKPLQGLAIL